MPKASSQARVSIVVGGDGYLNDQKVRELSHRALRERPDATITELDAAEADRYAFEEAVSPSLLSDSSVVVVRNLQNADERLGETIAEYCRQTIGAPTASVVICQHEGGVKGKRIREQIVKAGAVEQKIPELKTADAKVNFVVQRFERLHRRIDPLAAQQLTAVLGERTGELAAMCEQLCFDFDDDPIGIDRVNQYLTADPQVTGFAVADRAMEGRTADAIVAMRSAIEQGTDPIALIGALASKLRTLAKASAVRSGAIARSEANIKSDYVFKLATRQLSGWSSPGLARCIQTLAWADEQSKTNGGDPVYALEQAIILIGRKGRDAQ